MQQSDIFLDPAAHATLSEMADEVEDKEISVFDALVQAFYLGQMDGQATSVIEEWEDDTRRKGKTDH